MPETQQIAGASEARMAKSTYGVITAGRIFENYNIKLCQDDLALVMKTPDSFYFKLIRMPLKNVFNGIIMQQAQDYQNFAQKLYVDYLLSGEGSKPNTSSGAATREEIESQRQQLIQITENFGEQKHAHEKLISKSQTLLIEDAREWNQQLTEMAEELKNLMMREGMKVNARAVFQVLTDVLVQYDFQTKPLADAEHPWDKAERELEVVLSDAMRQQFIAQLEKLSVFKDSSQAQRQKLMDDILHCGSQLKSYRQQFREIIINVKRLMGQLSEYRMDMQQIENNLNELQFDPQLGEM